jgi:hypothetical protein
VTASSVELDWVSGVLWGASDDVEVGLNGRARHGRIVDELAVLPSVQRPRLLVPLTSARAASRALRHYTTSKRTVRWGTAVLAAGARVGLGHTLFRDRLSVSVPAGAADHDLAEIVLEEHLKRVLGRRDIHVGVVFNAGRPQKKPVLWLIDARGNLIAYAKIGWNAHTRALVRHEANVLRQLTERKPPPRSFDVAALIYGGRWQSLEVLVVEAHPGSPWYRRRRMLTELPLDATREAAALEEPLATRAFASSDYWTRYRGRIGDSGLGSGNTDATEAVSELVARLEERYSDLELSFGTAHGDWLPWNMGVVADRLLVWDWERAATHVPVGTDAIHFLFQVELNLRRRSPRVAVARTLELARELFPSLTLPRRLAPLLLALHLIEMTLRLEEGRSGGVGGVISNSRYHHSVKALLEELRGVPRD